MKQSIIWYANAIFKASLIYKIPIKTVDLSYISRPLKKVITANFRTTGP